MQIKKTKDIFYEDCGNAYTDCINNPEKEWVSIDDLLDWCKDYECKHSDEDEEYLVCNCCDSLSELRKILKHKVGGINNEDRD